MQQKLNTTPLRLLIGGEKLGNNQTVSAESLQISQGHKAFLRNNQETVSQGT